MRLISVVREELMIGQPLRWVLYDQERNVLMDRGAVIANAAQLKSVLEVNPLREPTPIADHAGANATEEAGKPPEKTFTFLDMKLRVGDRIQLQLPASMGTERYVVKLIGYAEGSSVLVTPPIANGMCLPVRAGDKIVARVFTSQTAFAFDSTIERVCKIPYDYLHLFYPAVVQGAVVRQAPRIKTRIIASIAKSGATDAEEKISGIIVNVSAHGALVCMRQPLDKKSQHITLSFRINLHEVDTHLNIKAIIRNVQIDETKGNGDPLKYQHGVQFLGMQPTDNMILQSLIYQQMIEHPHNLI
ncbi:MAG TPA: flagellar brake protein [Burkholderiaceae bacterium]|jgi:c-di-GMP-binding flagellar brake protein YcgR|nr:flagellar brake protein [Burkholderiaceae bacterium]